VTNDDLLGMIRESDPETGLRAAVALRRLAEQVEATHVKAARAHGWSWEQIGDALGISRQAAHVKYEGKKGN
jgi:hypothetical protein